MHPAVLGRLIAPVSVVVSKMQSNASRFSSRLSARKIWATPGKHLSVAGSMSGIVQRK
jgi:hypothetical protein